MALVKELPLLVLLVLGDPNSELGDFQETEQAFELAKNSFLIRFGKELQDDIRFLESLGTATSIVGWAS